MRIFILVDIIVFDTFRQNTNFFAPCVFHKALCKVNKLGLDSFFLSQSPGLSGKLMRNDTNTNPRCPPGNLKKIYKKGLILWKIGAIM